MTLSARRICRRTDDEDETRPKITFLPGSKSAEDSVEQVPSVADLSTPLRTNSVPELSYSVHPHGWVTTTVTGKTCRALVEHSKESNVHGREIGGLLVGYRNLHETANGLSYHELVVTNTVPVKSFHSSSVQLTFTEDEWRKAEEFVRHQLAPEGKTRLGWYHTHPLQGIFFSSDDQECHKLFSEPYEFAMVIDPRTMEAGLFYWASVSDQRIAGPICFPLT